MRESACLFTEILSWKIWQFHWCNSAGQGENRFKLASAEAQSKLKAEKNYSIETKARSKWCVFPFFGNSISQKLTLPSRMEMLFVIFVKKSEERFCETRIGNSTYYNIACVINTILPLTYQVLLNSFPSEMSTTCNESRFRKISFQCNYISWKFHFNEMKTTCYQGSASLQNSKLRIDSIRCIDYSNTSCQRHNRLKNGYFWKIFRSFWVDMSELWVSLDI